MIESLASLGLPVSIVAMFAWIVYITKNHLNERKEWREVSTEEMRECRTVNNNLTNKVIDIVEKNTSALKNLSSLIKR